MIQWIICSAERHDQPGALAFGGADGAKDVGPFGALVVGCAGPGSAPDPAPGDGVLLADPHLVLEPQLYFGPGREARPYLRQLGGEVFCNYPPPMREGANRDKRFG